MKGFSAIWAYRNFIYASIKSELKGRFARSRLGAAWFILHPLAQAAIFAVVLSEVLAAKLPGIDDKAGYAIYLMAGMAAWGLFAEIVNRCTSIFLEYAGALKKISFPRLCLPVIVAGNALLNHFLLLVAIAVVFLFFGHFPNRAWLVLPVGVALIATFAFGLGILVGVFNVFARDVGQVVSIVLQFWFWLTPIVYPLQVLPASFRPAVEANPMVPLVGIYQNALLHGKWPDWTPLIGPAVLALALVVVAHALFRRASPELVDVL
jgi:lipopolysaccharide transport system permease protein